jgi:Cupin-like domain
MAEATTTSTPDSDGANNTMARLFFERYIRRRRPCVLTMRVTTAAATTAAAATAVPSQPRQRRQQRLISCDDCTFADGDDNDSNTRPTQNDGDDDDDAPDFDGIGRMEYTNSEWFPQTAHLNAILTHWLLQPQRSSSDEMLVQVEQRGSLQERFGQARSRDRQVTLPLSSLVRHYLHIPNKMDGSKTAAAAAAAAAASSSLATALDVDPSLYYLSTQDIVGDDNTQEDTVTDDSQSPPEPPYWSEPGRTLREAHLLPSRLPLAGHLRLHQCQVWMGYCATNTTTASNTATHSGLHHDYHDNFYTVLAGGKEFILYPPTDAHVLAVAGDICTIHANGLVSYANAPIHADGRRPVQLEPMDDTEEDAAMEPRLKRPRTMTAERNESEEDDDDDDEQEVVLGRGFDYQSDSDNDHVDWNDTTRDDFDEIEQSEKDKEVATTENNTNDNETHALPNHFSRLDPTVSGYTVPATATEYRVRLQAGDTLYLPASWFHCVVSHASTSSDKDASNDDSNQVSRSLVHQSDTGTAIAAAAAAAAAATSAAAEPNPTSSLNGSALAMSADTPPDIAMIPPELHLAVNYWYHPPDNLDNYQHPYRDGAYWE